MKRRSLISGMIAIVAGILPAKAEDGAGCKLFGHQWVFDRNELGPQGTYGQWWWEFSKCKRCGKEVRELVASPRG